MAKSNGKANGHAEAETIYGDDCGLPEEFVEALDRAAAGETITVGDKVLQRGEVHEAAIQRLPRSNDAVVLHIRHKSRSDWRPVCRFDKRRYGSREFVVGRRFLAPLSARALRGLELAFERDHQWNALGNVLLKPGEHFEPVALEAVSGKRRIRGGSTLYVKYLGLWFPAGTTLRPRGAVVREPRVYGGGEAFPDSKFVV